MRLDPEEADLVRTTFRALEGDMAAATASFYAHLFRLMPPARGLFVTDIDKQGMKLAETLRAVVAQIDNWGLLRPQLEDLALRHTAYGVRPEHYAPTGVALRLMLAERLGPAYGAAADAAWARLYQAVAGAMIAGGYPVPQDTAR